MQSVSEPTRSPSAHNARKVMKSCFVGPKMIGVEHEVLREEDHDRNHDQGDHRAHEVPPQRLEVVEEAHLRLLRGELVYVYLV